MAAGNMSASDIVRVVAPVLSYGGILQMNLTVYWADERDPTEFENVADIETTGDMAVIDGEYYTGVDGLKVKA